MKKIVQRLVYYTNIAFAFLMLLSVLALYIKPDIWIIPSFLALFFPFFFFINTSFLVVYIYYKKKYFWVSLVALALSYPALSNSFAFNFSVKSDMQEFKLMSYNVRLFNLYDWIEDVKVGDEIISLIQKEQPDILCIQEFYSNPESRNYLEEIMAAGNFKHYYCPGISKGNSYGSAIFTRFPIKNYGTLNADESNSTFVYADIEAFGKLIRVYSLHLASLYLNEEDYHFIDNFTEKDRVKTIEAFSGIMDKMLYAYNKRLDEVEFISKHSGNSELPVILCGDFNDVPVSYAYRYFQNLYKDAFKEAGFGTGNTYIRRFIRFRIDYVFYGDVIEALDFRVIRKQLSDHYPVVVTFGL